jgi:hypothetical protein
MKVGRWFTPRPGHFTPRGKRRVPIVQEAGWAPSPVERHAWATVQMTIKRTEVAPRREKTVTLHKILVGKKKSSDHVWNQRIHTGTILHWLKKKQFDTVLAVTYHER